MMTPRSATTRAIDTPAAEPAALLRVLPKSGNRSKRLDATAGLYLRLWRRFRQNRIAVTALAILAIVVIFVATADLLSLAVGFSADDGDLNQQLLPPLTAGHLLGTDVNGRDVLVRLSYGGRASLAVAGIASVVTLAIGSIVGAVAGFFGGLIDSVLMRLVDVLLCLPGLSLLILISVLYKPGPIGLAFIIAAVGWTGISRLVRAEVLGLRSQDFVLAAHISGASNARVVTRHLVPNVLPTMMVWISLAIPGLILTEAALSFLGFGVKIPTPSWGNMLEQAKNFYTRSWTNVFFPGALIYVTVLAVNIVGTGLRDALDPRLYD